VLLESPEGYLKLLSFPIIRSTNFYFILALTTKQSLFIGLSVLVVILAYYKQTEIQQPTIQTIKSEVAMSKISRLIKSVVPSIPTKEGNLAG
jgi:hypothetical protein